MQQTIDPLTTLPNRAAFFSRLEEALSHPGEHDSAHLCFIDLDNFKPVNDTAGHRAGDDLLRQVAQIFSNAVREKDMVARIGGDEFAVLLLGAEDPFATADRLLTSLHSFRYIWHEKHFKIGASIGIVALKPYMTSDEALELADAACYRAKEQGRNRIVVAETEGEHLRLRQAWTEKLSEALEQGRVETAWRTRICQDGSYRRVEIRVKCSDGRYAAPAAFLPAAERGGMMPLLDLHCAQAAAEFAAAGHRCVVRLSKATLGDEDTLAKIEQILVGARGTIAAEVSEQALLSVIAAATRISRRLRAAGGAFGVYDFSSLGVIDFLRVIAPEHIGIDHAFTSGLGDPLHRAVTQALIDIAHAAGAKALCVEVNDHGALSALQGMGADSFEGAAV